MERQTMAREFENYVTVYGTSKETYQAMREIIMLCERLTGEDVPEHLDKWKIGTDFIVVRLDPFQTTHWESPNEYVSEFSQKCPNVVIEWTYCGDHELYCSVFKNGNVLAEYEAGDHPGGRRGR